MSLVCDGFLLLSIVYFGLARRFFLAAARMGLKCICYSLIVGGTGRTKRSLYTTVPRIPPAV